MTVTTTTTTMATMGRVGLPQSDYNNTATIWSGSGCRSAASSQDILVANFPPTNGTELCLLFNTLFDTGLGVACKALEYTKGEL